MSSRAKAIQGDGAMPRATDEDDVEGHGVKSVRAIGGEGVKNPRATDEDDVEGHAGVKSSRAIEGEGVHNPRATDEDDVEGHNIGVMNPMLARELTKARERDVQRTASRNSLIGEAKRALGRKR